MHAHASVRIRQRRVFRLLSLLLLVVSGTRCAQAQSCTIYPTNVNFGNYTGAPNSPGGSALGVRCPSGVTFQILLDAGQGSGASPTARKMTSGSNTLNYGLYQDSARSTNWGNSTATGYVQGTGAGTGTTQTYYVYPQLTSGQPAPPGTYTDTITVQVNDGSYTASSTFTVTATVAASCSISVGALAFGNYDPTSPITGATAPVTVTCTNTTTYNVGFDLGTGTGSTVTTHYMTGPSSNLLPYHLFQDYARSKVWGNTVGTNTVAGTGTGSAQILTVYGFLYNNHYLIPGSYTDTVTATVTY